MASGTQDIDLFVREALAKGCSRESIEQALAAAGWPPEQSRSALAVYADVAFALPVPKPRPYLSAREAFLYLLLFVALYISAFHFGRMVFDLISVALPDPAEPGYQNDQLMGSIRWSIASVVIAFPLYLFIASFLGKEMTHSPVKRLSAVRRWLTYLTLFIAATVLMADMITLVNGVLAGELTLRFVLKVVVAAVIAGGIFGYYLWDLRREEKEP
ncbi:MAG: hypothetical protein DCF27_11605 [Lysobacteraceae bacterium]|nr:MAG: hypothetical protein DCF27_11605 [Xanthomonadaceae bacterium]